MSIHAMNLVWKLYPKGGSEKLALLALADWCDDDGGNLYPSIGTVARKICVSTSQARRIIHGFIEDGLLQVVGNHNGGAKSQTRRYQINLSKLDLTPSVRATPRTDATPSTHARDHWHPCALPLAPMQANTSLTIKEPPIGSELGKVDEQTKPKKPKTKRSEETLQAFLDRCHAENVKPVAATDPIFEYAETVGVGGLVPLAWFVFKSKHLPTDKKQKDWRAHFRGAVRGNWLKLWYFADDESAALTTAGKQAMREMTANRGAA